MTPRGQRRAAPVLLAVCLLAGCTTADRPDRPEPTSAAPAPAPRTERADVSEAPYGEAPREAPAVSLRDTVDLSPAAEGTSAFATAVAPGPGGSAFVLVTAPDTDDPYRLATVAPVDGRLGVAGSVPVPGMRLIWGMHPLPDGTVAVSGWFQPAERGFGFTVVDPRSGESRVVEAIPYEEGTVTAYGSSALSADGSTLYLFTGTTVAYRSTDLLVAVDAATGDFLAGRDLLEETRGRSTRPVGRFAAGLVPRPDGGVVLAFSGVPPGERERDSVPTLLVYDADLSPVDYRLPDGAGATGETLAVAAGASGTVYVAVSGAGQEWLLTGAGGEGPTTRALELAPRGVDFSFVVDPTEGWVLLPAVDGVRAVDLATGAAGTVGLGCGMGFPARYLAAGSGSTVALAVGDCAEGADRIPTLWTFGT